MVQHNEENDEQIDREEAQKITSKASSGLKELQ